MNIGIKLPHTHIHMDTEEWWWKDIAHWWKTIDNPFLFFMCDGTLKVSLHSAHITSNSQHKVRGRTPTVGVGVNKGHFTLIIATSSYVNLEPVKA